MQAQNQSYFVASKLSFKMPQKFTTKWNKKYGMLFQIILNWKASNSYLTNFFSSISLIFAPVTEFLHLKKSFCVCSLLLCHTIVCLPFILLLFHNVIGCVENMLGNLSKCKTFSTVHSIRTIILVHFHS